MTIHFNGLFDSQLNITMRTRLRAHSSLIMMSNHHSAQFHACC